MCHSDFVCEERNGGNKINQLDKGAGAKFFICVSRAHSQGFIWAQKCNNSLRHAQTQKVEKPQRAESSCPLTERVTLAVIAGHLDCAEHGQVV